MDTVQLGLRFDADIVDKMRYAAWFKRESMTEAIVTAWSNYLRDFEAENGPITPEQIAQAQKKGKK